MPLILQKHTINFALMQARGKCVNYNLSLVIAGIITPQSPKAYVLVNAEGSSSSSPPQKLVLCEFN